MAKDEIIEVPIQALPRIPIKWWKALVDSIVQRKMHMNPARTSIATSQIPQ